MGPIGIQVIGKCELPFGARMKIWVLNKNTKWPLNYWVISPAPSQVCFKEYLFLVKYWTSKDLTYHFHWFIFVAMKIPISPISDYLYTFHFLLHLINIISNVAKSIYIHVQSYLMLKLLWQ